MQRSCLIFIKLLLIQVCILSLTTGTPAREKGEVLVFDPSAFVNRTLEVEGRQVAYRACEGIVTVSNPVDTRYQCINLYVPAVYFEGGSLNGYTRSTAPIFLPNGVGGYMPARPGMPGKALFRPGPNAIALALARGYVVAAPGARGSTLTDGQGHFTGKAPACIVDLKAAIRYLRHNTGTIPGNTDRIISNGTSAGGALSALLGATGNSPDYAPYLKALGAAEERDDIFAASCYCPITDLDHADLAYEWLFALPVPAETRGLEDSASGREILLSAELKRLFPAYLNSLGLRKADGAVLSLDEAGEGSFREHVKSHVVASAQAALSGGKDLSKLTWIKVREGVVTDLNFSAYLSYVTRMKSPGAFDAPDMGSFENRLFGTASEDRRHFTRLQADKGAASPVADADIVKCMNPLPYLGSGRATIAPQWRIRHGTKDRDTSLAVPVILATRLQNLECKVDFALPWDRGHEGDYDLNELFSWIDRIAR